MIPTRCRVRKIRQLIEVWTDTVTRPDTTCELYVDDDDPQLDDYLNLQADAPPAFSVHIGPRDQLGPMLNRHALDVATRCDVIGNIGDDHRPRTHGWDALIHDAVAAETPCMLYGDDLLQGERLPTAIFMSPQIVTTLGYMVPPGMIHLYLDDVWRELGNAAGCLRYRPDIIIEHMHPGANKAGWDPIYLESNSPELYAHDGKLYKEYLDSQVAVDAAKLRALSG